jgi:hypothetical protein
MIRWSAILLTGLSAAVLGGCQSEEKLVRYKPFFSGLDNVHTETAAVQARHDLEISESGEIGEDSLVIVNPDGSKRLIAKSGVQLMAHIRRTLAEEEADLFVDQILSRLTREEFYQRGLDPRDGFKTLKAHEREILLLFSRMPMGEHSPNVRMEALGKNAFRVRLTGRVADTVGRYRGFDMILEEGNWKLRWFN